MNRGEVLEQGPWARYLAAVAAAQKAEANVEPLLERHAGELADVLAEVRKAVAA